MALATALASGAAAQQAPPKPAPAQRPLPRDGFPVGPAAHIDSFTVNPGAIQPGQAVTLAWAAVNADRITLDPGIGIVAARDSRMVTPRVTTTYTLRVFGFGGKLAGRNPSRCSSPGQRPRPSKPPLPRTIPSPTNPSHTCPTAIPTSTGFTSRRTIRSA